VNDTTLEKNLLILHIQKLQSPSCVAPIVQPTYRHNIIQRCLPRRPPIASQQVKP